MKETFKVIAVFALSGLLSSCNRFGGHPNVNPVNAPVLKELSFASEADTPDVVWSFGEHPYKMQSNTQGLLRVHGEIRRNSVELTGTNIGQILRSPIGTFEWRGSIGVDSTAQGTGWCQIDMLGRSNEKAKDGPNN